MGTPIFTLPVDDMSPTENGLSVFFEEDFHSCLGEDVGLLKVGANGLGGDMLVGNFISKVMVNGVDVSGSWANFVNSCHLQCCQVVFETFASHNWRRLHMNNLVIDLFK